MSKDRPEEKKDLFAADATLEGVYDLSMARARALEHAQKSFGKTVKGKHIPLIWDVEKAAFNEDDNCFDIVLSCHPEEGEYLRKGEWEYHVSPKGELLPGTPLLRSSLRLKEEARKLSPLLLGAVAAVVLVVVLAVGAFAAGVFGRGAAPEPTATPTVAAVVPPVAKPTPTPTRVSTPVSGQQRFTLTINQVGQGIILRSPPPGPDGKYSPGTAVSLTVGVGVPGWAFKGFSGPLLSASKPPAPPNAIVVMDSDKVVTGTFAFEAVGPTPTPTRVPPTPAPTVPVALASDPYRDEANQFSLRYPQGWQKLSATGTAVAFVAPQPDVVPGNQQFSANINVVVESTNAASLDDYLSAASQGMKQMLTNYQEVSRRQVTLDTSPAYFLESTFDQGGFSLHVLQAILLKGNRAYVTTGTTHVSTWAQYKDLLEASLRSFQFMAAPVPPTPTPTPVPTVTGTYRGTITNLTAGQTAPFDLQLQESGTVTITLSGYGRVYPPLVGEGPIRGQRTGNRVSFDSAYSYLGYAFIASFEGTVSPDYKTLSGTYRVSPTGEVGTWQVTRVG